MTQKRKHVRIVGVFNPTPQQQDKRVIYKGWRQMVSIRYTRYRQACESGDPDKIAEAQADLEKYKSVFGAEVMLPDGGDPRTAKKNG